MFVSILVKSYNEELQFEKFMISSMLLAHICNLSRPVDEIRGWLVNSLIGYVTGWNSDVCTLLIIKIAAFIIYTL